MLQTAVLQISTLGLLQRFRKPIFMARMKILTTLTKIISNLSTGDIFEDSEFLGFALSREWLTWLTGGYTVAIGNKAQVPPQLHFFSS